MLGQRIRKLRETLGLTQEGFATNLDMSDRTVQRWETGNQDIQKVSLRMIEIIYNVNPEWLREGKGEMFLPSLNPALHEIFESLKSLPDNKQTWAAEEILMNTNIKKILE